MFRVRHHLLRHRWLAVWLVVAALLMKVLVPNGFMPGMANGVIVIQLCTGQGPQTALMAIPGKTGEQDGDHRTKADMPCAFSGLSAPSLAATDPILLAIAFAFILATAFRAAPAARPRRDSYVRPPSQGPPATA